jgi:cytochrome c oxidase cbb3-type subunit 2
VRGSAIAAAFLPGVCPSTAQAQANPGKAVYDKWCAGCHGADGKGAGPAAGHMLPRPRDFTQALYQIRSTATGQLPTDADIRKVIDDGMPGTAMPGWKNVLSEGERDQLVTHLKSFSRFFANQKTPLTPLEFGRAPGVNEERLKSGKEWYDKIECWKCHGRAGRGDGPSARTQQDDNNQPIRPADLTEPWYFNGGHTVEDIFRRLRTGLDGTPMPTFSDLLEGDKPFMTEDQLWNVALYVRSLAPEKVPQVRDVVRAAEVQGALPAAPKDSAWREVERFYIPLVGQIVVKPRWFAPTVDGVWVQALHNGTELAVRVTWHDPSKSPDPEWDEWQGLVTSFMEPHEEPGSSAAGGPTSPGAAAQAPATGPAPAPTASATPPAPSVAPLPDKLVVQFPVSIPTGMERPYFLMGTSGKPTYLWTWQSNPEAAQEARGKGFGNVEALGGGQLAARSSFDQGEWSVVFRRPLANADSANRLNFRSGVAIPMAIFAWDGNNGETGTKGSISTWYYIYLDQKTPATVYTAPAATIMLTAGLGLLFVRRAQKRKNGSNS